MRFRSVLAALLSFLLVTETTRVVRAADHEEAVESAPAAAEDAAARLTPFWAVSPPNEIDVGARLALAGPMADGVMPFGTTPKAMMSNNTKTVLIVAIIAGAVLLVVGVIVIGKPFGKKP